MNCASARCSAASGPVSTAKRAPESRLAAAKSSRRDARRSRHGRPVGSRSPAARQRAAFRRWRTRRCQPARSRATGSVHPAAACRVPPAGRGAVSAAASRSPESRPQPAGARCPRRDAWDWPIARERVLRFVAQRIDADLRLLATAAPELRERSAVRELVTAPRGLVTAVGVHCAAVVDPAR